MKQKNNIVYLPPQWITSKKCERQIDSTETKAREAFQSGRVLPNVEPRRRVKYGSSRMDLYRAAREEMLEMDEAA